ncbi:MAG: nucleotide sugar dehydrogenase [Clostridiales bacterium]|nr:nucleotide sugar dehydrogenase [Clostridiales bacterium]
MQICVIGLGYIGLPTAAVFAAHGHQVVGVDKNPAVLEALKKGEVIIEEVGLPQLVKEVVEAGSLRPAEAPEAADAFIISVPTPIKPDKGSDLSYVESAARSLLPVLKKGDLVILESTSPVGTVDDVLLPILAESGLDPKTDLYVGHSPERVIPGKILEELIQNDRIAGGINPESAKKISELYKTFVKGEIYETTASTAELCKLAENTYRDVNIAFANELAKICESLDINVWELISLCNKHPRVNIHQPGPGVGGHCIAVDPWFIAEKRPELAKIIRLSRDTNDSMPAYVADRVMEILKGVDQPKVGILGVTYKPDVDDMRESPILELIEILEEKGVNVAVNDPFVKKYAGDVLEMAKDADLLLLGVHHKAFLDLPFEQLAQAMRNKNFFDTRNFLDAEALRKAGFSVSVLGI